MMGDGENVNRVFKTGSMDDVGSRFKFLAELYDLWEAGIDILNRYDKQTPGYEEKKTELEHALKLLGYHLQKDYDEKDIRNVVDALPKHGEDIKDENQN